MKATGYTVMRSDGVTYLSIAAASRVNHIAETTMQRHIDNGTKGYCGFSCHNRTDAARRAAGRQIPWR